MFFFTDKLLFHLIHGKKTTDHKLELFLFSFFFFPSTFTAHPSDQLLKPGLLVVVVLEWTWRSWRLDASKKNMVVWWPQKGRLLWWPCKYTPPWNEQQASSALKIGWVLQIGGSTKSPVSEASNWGVSDFFFVTIYETPIPFMVGFFSRIIDGNPWDFRGCQWLVWRTKTLDDFAPKTWAWLYEWRFELGAICQKTYSQEISWSCLLPHLRLSSKQLF